MVEPLTDEELARRVQSRRDLESLNELIRRYQPKLLAYGHRLLYRANDVEDLVQEVFIKAYQNIQGFDPDRRFSPWIYRLAHNQFIDALRKRKNEPVPFFNADELFPHPVAADNPAADVDQKFLRQQLETSLDKLDFKYREALVLRYFEELSYQEIAEVLRLPIGTVSIRLQRGLQQLRAIQPPL